MNPRHLGLIYAIATGLCWAILAIGLKYALQFSSSGTIAWVRMIVAFALMFVYYSVRQPTVVRRVFTEPPLQLVIAAVLLSCNYYGYMRGIEYTNASNAQIMIQLGPLTLLLMGVFFFKENLRLAQWLGIFIALLGFFFFNWDQILVALDHSDTYIHGNIWILFAAITWAIFAALQKHELMKSDSWPPQMMNFLIYGVCCVALLPMTQWSDFAALTTWQWFVLFLLGVNTLVAYGAFVEAINLIPASHVSLVISVNPLLTIFLVWCISHWGLTFISPEPILWRGQLGAFLVVLGVATAVSLREKPKMPVQVPLKLE